MKALNIAGDGGCAGVSPKAHRAETIRVDRAELRPRLFRQRHRVTPASARTTFERRAARSTLFVTDGLMLRCVHESAEKAHYSRMNYRLSVADADQANGDRLDAGLCADCVHARRVHSDRGSEFSMGTRRAVRG